MINVSIRLRFLYEYVHIDATDREGLQRMSVEVIASEMEMLSPKPASSLVQEGENHDPFLPDLPEDAS